MSKNSGDVHIPIPTIGSIPTTNVATTSTLSPINFPMVVPPGTSVWNPTSLGSGTAWNPIHINYDSPELQLAVQKEIRKFLSDNLEIDIFSWNDQNQTITIQICIDKKVLSEKSFNLNIKED